MARRARSTCRRCCNRWWAPGCPRLCAATSIRPARSAPRSCPLQAPRPPTLARTRCSRVCSTPIRPSRQVWRRQTQTQHTQTALSFCLLRGFGHTQHNNTTQYTHTIPRTFEMCIDTHPTTTKSITWTWSDKNVHQVFLGNILREFRSIVIYYVKRTQIFFDDVSLNVILPNTYTQCLISYLSTQTHTSLEFSLPLFSLSNL